ncbi:unnamed protein product, partial [Amoebophrya sp. A25]
ETPPPLADAHSKQPGTYLGLVPRRTHSKRRKFLRQVSHRMKKIRVEGMKAPGLPNIMEKM